VFVCIVFAYCIHIIHLIATRATVLILNVKLTNVNTILCTTLRETI